MSKYMSIAEDANEVAKELYVLATEPNGLMASLTEEVYKGRVSSLLGQLYNLGIRTAPRPTQATVRYNAVERAMEGLPVIVTKETRTNEQTQQTYNVVIVTPKEG